MSKQLTPKQEKELLKIQKDQLAKGMLAIRDKSRTIKK